MSDDDLVLDEFERRMVDCCEGRKARDPRPRTWLLIAAGIAVFWTLVVLGLKAAA